MGFKHINYQPKMTRYLINNRLFDSRKLVVIDVGARLGGEKHWDVYGNQAMIIGFEPDEQECNNLNKKSNSKSQLYFPVALDKEKGTRTFYITKFDASSGFYKRDMRFWSRLSCKENVSVKGTRKVETVDFDNFAKHNNIGYADFMKVDVEGAELDILKGCVNFIRDGLVLGVASEVTFVDVGEQPVFSEVDTFLRGQGFKLFDIEVSRFTREVLTQPEELSEIGQTASSGQVIGADVLYLRDGVAEIEEPEKVSRWDDNSILKLASIFEIYGLNDCAIELLQAGKKKGFLKGLDIDYLMDLLTPRFMDRDLTYREHIKTLEYIRTKGYKNSIPLIDIARRDSRLIKHIIWGDLKAIGERCLPGQIKSFIRKNLFRRVT